MAIDPGNTQTSAVRRGKSHDPRFTAAIIPTNALDCLMQIAEERGVATGAWFNGLALTRAQLNDAAVRVSYREASLIIKRAMRALAQNSLGLDVGRRQSVGTFGVLGLAMMTARTFGESMQIGIENHQVAGSMMEVGFDVVDANSVAMVAEPRFVDGEILPFLCEELFISSLMVSRALVGANFHPRYVEFTYPQPAWADAYRETFQCEVRFDMPQNRAVIDTSWMSYELPTHHPVSAQQALGLCRQMRANVAGPQPEIVVAVERMLRSRLHENPTVTEVAQSLHLTERSLRRHLAAGGQIFRDMHDRIRTERALELLRDGRHTVSEIGSVIGFSDAREFRRAFKRWTGQSPCTVREMR
ncbi:AraC family transcriptional regulator [Pseudolysobacter antarcticus]|uniref:AraC family transcriptional regulator n=1 Tax=Pseudolysobacter antarcticus TaxID=2511995 RepID=A0A411HHJ1_9GAMM|nr:AraC family transcriptional regulator [Pseudolysobacter antarcticus]QBB69988.1 AraC family transcriptional regulator [Pseudolysobacter antarcticus]